MSPEEKLDFFRRVTCAHNVYSPPFTFGRKVESSGRDEVRERWRLACDRSDLRGTTSLYLHVPFCKSRRCSFCMYGSSTDCSPSRLDRYREKIVRELEEWRVELPSTVQNLYVGGGTPSVYSPQGLYELLHPFSIFSYAADGERTCEMSPSTATLEHIDAVADVGINRLSMGVQSFDETVLAAVSRQSVAMDHIAALCRYAREKRFVDVNLDLMLGLPKITAENLRESVRKVADCGALSSSVYYWRQTPVARDRLACEFEIVRDEMSRLGWTLESGSADSEHHQFCSPERRRGTTRLVTNANCVDNHRVIGIGTYANGFRSGFSYSNVGAARINYWQMNADLQIRMAMSIFLYFGNGHLASRAFRRVFGLDAKDYFKNEFAALRELCALEETDEGVTLVGESAIDRISLQKFFWDWDYLKREYGGGR